MMEIKKVAEGQENRDGEEEVMRSEKEEKKLVPEHFHQQIHVFRKKTSERMSIKKLWDYAIETKEGFVLRNVKIYPYQNN